MRLPCIGTGLTLNFIPLFAGNLGASEAMCVLVAGLDYLGLLIFDLPAGYLVGKWGLRRSMVFSSILMAAIVILPALFPHLLVLIFSHLLLGCFNAIYFLALTAYSGQEIPTHVRGRGLASMGGILRIGFFIGPVLGGLLAQNFGYRSLFVIKAILILLCSILLWLFLKPKEQKPVVPKNYFKTLGKTFKAHRRVYLTSGIVMMVLMMLRAARPVLISLWGKSLHLDLTAIGFIASLGHLIDLITFIPSGYLMDKKGRKTAAFICMAVLSLGFILLPFSQGFCTFLLCSLFIGLGNGLGSGIILTFGADVTPEKDGAFFLGIWRSITDAGGAVGTWLMAPIAAIISLGVSSLSLGGLGILAVIYLQLAVKETSTHQRPPANANHPEGG